MSLIEQAKDFYEQGKEAYRSNSPELDSALDAFNKAIQLFEEVLANQELPNRDDILREQANALNFKGAIQTEKKQAKSAQKTHEKALSIYKEIGDLIGQASALYGIGEASRIGEELQDSLNSLNEALDLLNSIALANGKDLPKEKSLVLKSLSDTYFAFAQSLGTLDDQQYPPTLG